MEKFVLINHYTPIQIGDVIQYKGVEYFIATNPDSDGDYTVINKEDLYFYHSKRVAKYGSKELFKTGEDFTDTCDYWYLDIDNLVNSNSMILSKNLTEGDEFLNGLYENTKD